MGEILLKFLTDANGQAYQFLLYLPFGEMVTDQKAGGYDSRYKYSGKETDENTGLNYHGARYFNPSISIWYGVDPLVEEYPGWSPFAYTMNNPITYVDPTGMSTENVGGDPPIYTARGPEVTISAQRIGSNHDQSTERYGYIGAWNDYQKEYNLRGWDYNNYLNYYNSVYRNDFDASVRRQDKEEAARITLEKLAFFTGPFKAGEELAYVLPGSQGAFVHRYRALFRFISPVASKGIQLTKHGAERIAGAAATRGGVLSMEEVGAIRSLVQNPIIQGDGAKVFIHEVSPGRFSGFIQNQNSGKLITSMNNWSKKAINKMGKNHGWSVE